MPADTDDTELVGRYIIRVVGEIKRNYLENGTTIISKDEMNISIIKPADGFSSSLTSYVAENSGYLVNVMLPEDYVAATHAPTFTSKGGEVTMGVRPAQHGTERRAGFFPKTYKTEEGSEVYRGIQSRFVHEFYDSTIAVDIAPR